MTLVMECVRTFSFMIFEYSGQDVKDTEFAIIAALQFIRHLNERR